MATCISHIAIALFGLNDSSGLHTQDTVFIQSRREQWATLGRFHQVIQAKETSVKNSLLFNGAGYMRQYGAGTIATIGRRGADPVQTQILWNGIPAANTALGITDLNLLTSNSNSRLTITDGPGSAFNGSGAIGGNINLGSTEITSPLMLNNTFTTGSYNTWCNNLFTACRIKKTGIQLSHQYSEARNNFPYTEPTPTGPVEKRTTNANTSAASISLGVNTEIKGINLFTVFESGNYYQRIPKTLTSSDQNAFQLNRYKRFFLSANKTWEKHYVQVKIAQINDLLWYNNEVFNTSDTTLCKSNYVLIDYLYSINKNFKLMLQFDAMHNTATVKQYGKKGIIDAPAGTASLRYQLNKLTAQLTSRYEMREGIFVYNAASEYQLHRLIKLFFNSGTTFRRATLNDIYWGGGSRDTLRPEYGRFIEIGYQLIKESKKKDLLFSLTQSGYARKIKDNIRWVPVGSDWLPVNFNHFSAAGVQSNLKFLKTFSSAFNIGTTSQIDIGEYYVWQTHSDKKRPLLIPAVNASSTVTMGIYRFKIDLIHTYTGKRSAEVIVMEPVSLWHSSVTCHFKVHKKYGIDLRLLVQNLMNTDYMVLPDRPMPQRNYQLSLNLQLQ